MINRMQPVDRVASSIHMVLSDDQAYVYNAYLIIYDNEIRKFGNPTKRLTRKA